MTQTWVSKYVTAAMDTRSPLKAEDASLPYNWFNTAWSLKTEAKKRINGSADDISFF